jgi:hypothetical protein
LSAASAIFPANIHQVRTRGGDIVSSGNTRTLDPGARVHCVLDTVQDVCTASMWGAGFVRRSLCVWRATTTMDPSDPRLLQVYDLVTSFEEGDGCSTLCHGLNGWGCQTQAEMTWEQLQAQIHSRFIFIPVERVDQILPIINQDRNINRAFGVGPPAPGKPWLFFAYANHGGAWCDDCIKRVESY